METENDIPNMSDSSSSSTTVSSGSTDSTPRSLQSRDDNMPTSFSPPHKVDFLSPAEVAILRKHGLTRDSPSKTNDSILSPNNQTLLNPDHRLIFKDAFHLQEDKIEEHSPVFGGTSKTPYDILKRPYGLRLLQMSDFVKTGSKLGPKVDSKFDLPLDRSKVDSEKSVKAVGGSEIDGDCLSHGIVSSPTSSHTATPREQGYAAVYDDDETKESQSASSRTATPSRTPTRRGDQLNVTPFSPSSTLTQGSSLPHSIAEQMSHWDLQEAVDSSSSATPTPTPSPFMKPKIQNYRFSGATPSSFDVNSSRKSNLPPPSRGLLDVVPPFLPRQTSYTSPSTSTTEVNEFATTKSEVSNSMHSQSMRTSLSQWSDCVQPRPADAEIDMERLFWKTLDYFDTGLHEYPTPNMTLRKLYHGFAAAYSIPISVAYSLFMYMFITLVCLFRPPPETIVSHPTWIAAKLRQHIFCRFVFGATAWAVNLTVKFYKPFFITLNFVLYNFSRLVISYFGAHSPHLNTQSYHPQSLLLHTDFSGLSSTLAPTLRIPNPVLVVLYYFIFINKPLTPKWTPSIPSSIRKTHRTVLQSVQITKAGYEANKREIEELEKRKKSKWFGKNEISLWEALVCLIREVEILNVKSGYPPYSHFAIHITTLLVLFVALSPLSYLLAVPPAPKLSKQTIRKLLYGHLLSSISNSPTTLPEVNPNTYNLRNGNDAGKAGKRDVSGYRQDELSTIVSPNCKEISNFNGHGVEIWLKGAVKVDGSHGLDDVE